MTTTSPSLQVCSRYSLSRLGEHLIAFIRFSLNGESDKAPVSLLIVGPDEAIFLAEALFTFFAYPDEGPAVPRCFVFGGTLQIEGTEPKKFSGRYQIMTGQASIRLVGDHDD